MIFSSVVVYRYLQICSSLWFTWGFLFWVVQLELYVIYFRVVGLSELNCIDTADMDPSFDKIKGWIFIIARCCSVLILITDELVWVKKERNYIHQLTEIWNIHVNQSSSFSVILQIDFLTQSLRMFENWDIVFQSNFNTGTLLLGVMFLNSNNLQFNPRI